MVRTVCGWVCAWLLVVGLVRGGPGAALACAGDCNGDGSISVAELIEGVRIGLDDAALSECPAFDVTPDGTLRIDELVAAVAAALDGCPATPTPSPSPSATATDTPADTPTATPTVPIVSGRWREDPLAVTTSTCLALLTQAFASELAARPVCEQSIAASSETAVALLDCTGTRVDGTLDRDGTMHFAYPTTSDAIVGCTVALATSVVIPAAVSPATAAYSFAIAFSGTCPLTDCTIAAHAVWTRE